MIKYLLYSVHCTLYSTVNNQPIIMVHSCPKNNLNIGRKTESVTAGADGTMHVRVGRRNSGTETLASSVASAPTVDAKSQIIFGTVCKGMEFKC